MNTYKISIKHYLFSILSLLTVLIFYSTAVQAASRKEIDIKTNTVLEEFRKGSAGADAFLKEAKGVLVFPEVVKAGVGIGGQYGEGVLRVKNNPVGYYSITGASLGVQLGAQLRSIILVFMTNESLGKFLEGNGWDIGVDGSVALINTGVGKDINTTNVDDPVVGFLISKKGLMFNLTLEGSKIRQLDFNEQNSSAGS